jgi:CHAD domain-containing protein
MQVSTHTLQRLDAGLRALREPLTPGSPLWAWAGESISRRAETMLAHLEGVRLGEDIEAVHDMRVGSRRLVAAMRVFEGCFPDDGYRRLLQEARRVTRRLGGVRDLDVLIDHYARLQPEAAEERLATEYLLATFRAARGRARPPMLRALDRSAASDFPARIGRYLRRRKEAYAVGLGPSGRSCGPCAAPFREAAPGFLTARYHLFYSFEPWVHRADVVEELHEMRIAAKWLRYTMELFAPAFADRLKQPLSAVKRLQELLGNLHDSDIRLDILRGTRARPLELGLLGWREIMLADRVERGLELLQEREEQQRAECYRAFYKEWGKLERREFPQRLLRRLQQPDAAEGDDNERE